MSDSEQARRLTELLQARPVLASRDGSSTNGNVNGMLLEDIKSFFETDAHSDIYSKENLGADSYLVTGQPCHGGYTDVQAEHDAQANREVELSPNKLRSSAIESSKD